jgi:uncharacterized membrane protein (Fun14 family)
MVAGTWLSILYLFGLGIFVGLIVGYSARKLNKLIAAIVGLTILAINLSHFVRIFNVDISFPLFGQLIEQFLRVLPFSSGSIYEAFDKVMLIASETPFIVGLIFGGVLGFKVI